MIRYLRIILASRRLAKHAAKNKADLERRGFVKRSAASKRGWMTRKGVA
jgi:hypothetical protein